ncbi:MAG: class I SAM-dependent methyltransferase [Dehalococcoidia bacterium]
MPQKFPVERREVLISPERRKSLDPARVISLLPIEPDHIVADVGCGNGFFTFPLAEHLTHGRVFAVDLQDEMLQDVRDRVAEEGIENIEVVRSKELDIPLGKGRIDGVFSAFMFHETLDPLAFLQLIGALLKPGGWLALLE